MQLYLPESRFYAPIEVQRIATQAQAELNYRINGFQPHPVVNCDHEDIVTSLTNFSQQFPNHPWFQELVTSYTKPDAIIPFGEYSISPSLKKGYNFLTGGGNTYNDGNYGLVLGVQEPGEKQNLWLAALGFDVGIWALADGSRKSYMFMKQLQAYDYKDMSLSGTQNLDQKVILNKLRWEHLLVALGISWASGVDIDQAVIQPANRNKYYEKSGTGEREAWQKRLKMRYDVTASRMGFKKDLNANWVLDIK
jgi:hypothetical protein